MAKKANLLPAFYRGRRSPYWFLSIGYIIGKFATRVIRTFFARPRIGGSGGEWLCAMFNNSTLGYRLFHLFTLPALKCIWPRLKSKAESELEIRRVKMVRRKKVQFLNTGASWMAQDRFRGRDERRRFTVRPFVLFMETRSVGIYDVPNFFAVWARPTGSYRSVPRIAATKPLPRLLVVREWVPVLGDDCFQQSYSIGMSIVNRHLLYALT